MSDVTNKRICIRVSNKQQWDDAQKVCFELGYDWERYEWDEWDFDLQKDVLKSEPDFALNDDGYHQDVDHLCVIDGNLYTNYVGDGNPIDDGFELKTIEELKRIK